MNSIAIWYTFVVDKVLITHTLSSNWKSPALKVDQKVVI